VRRRFSLARPRRRRTGHIGRDPTPDLRILWSTLNQISQFGKAEVWNNDQGLHWGGGGDLIYVRAVMEALIELIQELKPDAVADFWNPRACIAARAAHKPLITVIQYHQHPQGAGFIWWKVTPANLPTPGTAINSILGEFRLQPILKTGELFLGDLTLVVRIPETDPLPNITKGSYIGPVLWQRPRQALPDWINGPGLANPPIWIYTGTP
jgi:hypothetical protein